MNPPRPLSLLCELTYRCNLQCAYCYNPVALDEYRDELSTEQWSTVLQQAADLGVVQAHFSGGEPTLRRDLPSIVAAASRSGLYTNLITQGTFLGDALLDRLIESGLNHIQISIQAPQAEMADHIAGAAVHDRKLTAIERVRDRNVALTVNCVLHRFNHDAIEGVIALAETLRITRLELANTQFYGWAYRNRGALIPTRRQVEHGERIVAAARERLRGRMEISYVFPDYFDEFPKPCMNGWGRQFITVAPNGYVFPCPAAATITTLQFENVRGRGLAEIWRDSDSFSRYRGTAWMSEPCRSCPRRELDWGGCRCQAFLLTGNAGATDPVCSLSPDHASIVALRDPQGKDEPIPRRA
ncbi:MAG: pyrroloquinoline quinone biosynthesis protein PqqE [Candidatus Eremiobacteraeota bacterium]|nr:pyrroloquinoline quinone biosynthesis protein PqqE [Candidatus Eremiobacteraeota bacterium]MBV9055074.1 pyrroloquinoline quinone biosynthesis protein PqqE [Candidatus Eremiobacteraeota bacterium]MBV9698856.1 pyrroloquinoline quinone biosynthesis protein PqqE [Candidatus Eremiobacteraeota bacterium]